MPAEVITRSRKVELQKTLNIERDVSLPRPRLLILEYSSGLRKEYREDEFKRRVDELYKDLRGHVSCITNISYVKGMDKHDVNNNPQYFDNLVEWSIMGDHTYFEESAQIDSIPKRFGVGGCEIFVGIESFGATEEYQRLGERGYELANKLGVYSIKPLECYDKMKITDIVRKHNSKL